MFRLLTAAVAAFSLAGCIDRTAVEPNIAPEMPFAQQTQTIGSDHVSFFETGTGGPTVLMLHGIPTNATLWRNVAPIVGQSAKVVAFDLPGYGASSLPSDGDVSYEGLYRPLAAYLDARPEDKFVLVVNDLGSLLGIDYAMRNPDRISGLVFVEAAFMPAKDWLAQLPLSQRAFFPIMRNDTIARFFIQDRPRFQNLALTMGMIRRLSAEERARYMDTYEDPAYRRVVLEGPGPKTMPRGAIPQEPNDLAAVMNRNAAALADSDIPMLLLTAEPGMITRRPAIEYAKATFKNVTVTPIGAGLHFLPEDQPTALGEAIRDWVATLHPNG